MFALIYALYTVPLAALMPFRPPLPSFPRKRESRTVLPYTAAAPAVLPAQAGIQNGIALYRNRPYRHSRVSGNPEMPGLMMPHPCQATAGFPLTRE